MYSPSERANPRSPPGPPQLTRGHPTPPFKYSGNGSELRIGDLLDTSIRRGLCSMQLKLPSRSSPKWRHKYDQDPATICSTVHYRLQNISPRFASSLGASVSIPRLEFNTSALNSHPLFLAVNAIINAIRKRQVVHRLYLGASSLGDAGCVRLFEFLASPAGLHCKESLTELFLTKNEIGAQGLLAVAAYLRGNSVLRELCLSGVSSHRSGSFLTHSSPRILEPSDH